MALAPAGRVRGGHSRLRALRRPPAARARRARFAGLTLRAVCARWWRLPRSPTTCRAYCESEVGREHRPGRRLSQSCRRPRTGSSGLRSGELIDCAESAVRQTCVRGQQAADSRPVGVDALTPIAAVHTFRPLEKRRAQHHRRHICAFACAPVAFLTCSAYTTERQRLACPTRSPCRSPSR